MILKDLEGFGRIFEALGSHFNAFGVILVIWELLGRPWGVLGVVS